MLHSDTVEDVPPDSDLHNDPEAAVQVRKFNWTFAYQLKNKNPQTF